MGILSIARRAIKILPEMTFGTSAEVFGTGYRAAAKGSSIWTKIKEGAKAVEKDVAKQAATGGGGFFKRCWKSLTSLPRDIAAGARMGYKKAMALNRRIENQLGSDVAKLIKKSPIKGALGGVCKAIGKRLPLIGVVLTGVFDGPKIFDAFKNKGFWAGIKETTGVGVELGCMAGGAAIGSCICPGLGTIIGGFAGAFAGMFVRDNVFSTEDPESAKSAAKYTNEEITLLKQMGLNDEEIAFAQENGLSVEDIKKILTQTQQPQKEQPDATKVNKPVKEDEIAGVNQDKKIPDLNNNETEKQETNKNQYTSFGTMTLPKVDVNQALNSVYSQLGSTGLYRPYSAGNIYSNDMYYKQVFNGIGQYNNSNPFEYQMQCNNIAS